jgi:serine protease AprX
MLGLSSPQMFVMSAPNPTSGTTTIRYRVETTSRVSIEVYNLRGNKIKTLVNQSQEPGVYSVNLALNNLASGVYLVKAVKNGVIQQTIRVIKN